MTDKKAHYGAKHGDIGGIDQDDAAHENIENTPIKSNPLIDGDVAAHEEIKKSSVTKNPNILDKDDAMHDFEQE